MPSKFHHAVIHFIAYYFIIMMMHLQKPDSRNKTMHQEVLVEYVLVQKSRTWQASFPPSENPAQMKLPVIG
jgi:hypothetical protein